MEITFTLFDLNQTEVVLSMMETFNAIDHYPFNRVERTENLKDLFTHPELGRLWIIKRGEVVVGYTFLGFGFSFEFRGRDAFVDELFILPEFQGQGFGKRAIDFITNEAKNLGVKALHLEAEKHNERALQLYRGKGFVDHKRFLLTKYL